MNRAFLSICTLDALALVIPTRWMGPWVEFGMALALAAVTASLWVCIRFANDDA